MAKHYLKPHIIIEPLISKWYAWLHLVSPLTAGFHLEKRHMKVLASFLEHKELHQQAAKNPKLAGGFFVNLDDNQYDLANTLLDQMRNNLAQLINLAHDIEVLEQNLAQVQQGESLEPFYESIPETLKGSVELLYDLRNQPSIRYIEPILYERYFDKSLQSLLLSHDKPTERLFVSSTPRLKKSADIEIIAPFDATHVDQIMASRESGIELQAFLATLDLSTEENTILRNMFTDKPPSIPIDREFKDQGVRVRYFGHACILLQTQHTSILIDPLILNEEHQQKNFSYFDLPKTIDAVLITHAHQDHLVLETLLQIRHKVKQIFVPRNNGGFLQDPSMKIMLRKLGFNSVNCLDEFQTVNVGDFTIKGIPFLGEHGDLNIQSKLAYYVMHNQHTFLFAVDSNNIDAELYKSIRDIIGTVDTVFIGMECKGAPYSWTYGPLSSQDINYKHDQSRRLSGSNSSKAWNIVETVAAQKAYVYAMGLEPWLSYLLGMTEDSNSLPIVESEHFIKLCQQNGVESSRLYLKNEFLYR